MSVERSINLAIRYGQAVVHTLKNFSLNKRFLNLNIFVGFLLLVIVGQSILIKYGSNANSSPHSLIVLKDEVHATNYDNILKKYDAAKFKKMSFTQKCNLYFDELSASNSGWVLDNFNTDGYDDDLYSFDTFLQAKKQKEPELKLTEEEITKLEKEYNDKAAISKKVDHGIIDAVSTLRIFGTCFIDDKISGKSKFDLINYFKDGETEDISGNDKDSTDRSNIQDLCLDTEARLFPWLSNILPVYKRWDGETSLGIPDLTNVGKYDDYEYTDLKKSKLAKRERSNCLLKSFRESINSKGYVISASDGQVDELKRLALILRAIGNKLPIQIVHKGDLSEDNQKVLINQFRREIKHQSLPSAFEKLNNVALKFPKQEVWFVNVKQSIKPEFRKHFHKYANKLLAYLFNSFEEMILIDTDTVPFVGLEEILKYPEYLSKGAYFYQDRQLKGQNTQNQVNYFKRLLPSKLDNHFFDIPLVTNHTLNNRFIGDLRNHFMESGVVAVNRKKHFVGMLISVQLNFWSTTATRIHGDKELFWLGLSIAGDENYVFNKYGAASIGTLTPNENKRLKNTPSKEVCSNHPGHIDGHEEDHNRLIWINSGFTFCKNTDSAGLDKDKPLFKGYTENDLRSYYQAPIQIRNAIIPPPQEIERENEAGNPSHGWTDEHKYCYGYTWCAYEFVGFGETEEDKGLVVNFNKNETVWFDFIGSLWMNGVPL